jgi:hypothetical protein
MERVAFLIEASNERLGCLLNPESLSLRREAGINSRASATGRLSGAGLSDDPLIYTGGGVTELDLDLLFDVSLAGSSIVSEDVRDLTRPLWNLAENSAPGSRDYGRPPVVRFIWGKAWNIPGVVVAVAERLEQFSQSGQPRRSWLRLRLRRVAEPENAPAARTINFQPPERVPGTGAPTESAIAVHEFHGGSPGGDAGSLTIPLPEITTALELDPTGLSAPDLIEEVARESGATALVEVAQSEVVDAVASITSALATLQPDDDAGTGAGRESLANTADELRDAITETGAAPRTGWVSAWQGGAARLRAAGRGLREAWERIRARASARVEQSDLASAMNEALERVGAAAMKFAEAAARLSEAVRARAASLVQRGLAQMGEAREDLAAGLALLSGAAGSAREVAASATSAVIELLDEARSRIRNQGELFISNRLPDALNRLAVVAEQLWAGGQQASARAVHGALLLMAAAVRRIRTAGEAAAAVEASAAIAEQRDAIRRARGTLERLRLSRDASTLREMREALALIEEQTTAAPPSALPNAIPAAIEAVRATLRGDEVSTAGEAIARIEAALETIEQATEEEASASGRAFASQVKEVLAAETGEEIDGMGALEPELGSARASAERQAQLAVGERLDHLAYHYYRDPAGWRLLAYFNDIDHPLRLATGRTLRVPPPGPGV